MIGVMLLSIASINDKNRAVRLSIIDNKLFSASERSALLYQLEIEPFSFAVVGVHVSVAGIVRLMLTVCSAFVPLLIRSVLSI